MIREERVPLRELTEDQLEALYLHIDALTNAPVLGNCLMPGCLRQFDSMATMAGDAPARPEWSGEGWWTLGPGSIFPTGGHICPDHKALVTAHWPRRIQLPSARWSVDCPCGWGPVPQRWHRLVAALWEQHLLAEAGELPPAPPLTDPEHRLPLAEHTEQSLAELYDRLWDAEADVPELRSLARTYTAGYGLAVPALLGAKTALEGLRTRITRDSRDWTADKLDALLWAVLVGWNCENADSEHVHTNVGCSGDQTLWNIARLHAIPMDQTIQTGQHRWWIANAIKTAQQIEDDTGQQQNTSRGRRENHGPAATPQAD
ncbi:hypothetical protein [Streptomyces sp. NPDC059819]|uniref:hypothetical protein n=1 Tax=Streptomyces sp. NPDC059819 TaxID=3346963 RepID=UPI00364B443C